MSLLGYTLKRHPVLSAILPPLHNGHLKKLCASIIRDGCLTPICTWVEGENEWIVDGHHRHDICVRHEVAFGVQRLEFKNLAEACAWALDHQEGRRNVTSETLSRARAELVESMKPEPQQGKRTDRPPSELPDTRVRKLKPQKPPEKQAPTKQEAVKQVAEAFDVSERTVYRDVAKAEGKPPPKKKPKPPPEEQTDIQCRACGGTGRVVHDCKMPPSLAASEDFAEAWCEWLAYRSISKLKAWKTPTIAGFFRKAEAWGPTAAAKALRRSIENGWQGVFAENEKPGKDDPRGNFKVREEYLKSL